MEYLRYSAGCYCECNHTWQPTVDAYFYDTLLWGEEAKDARIQHSFLPLCLHIDRYMCLAELTLCCVLQRDVHEDSTRSGGLCFSVQVSRPNLRFSSELQKGAAKVILHAM